MTFVTYPSFFHVLPVLVNVTNSSQYILHTSLKDFIFFLSPDVSWSNSIIKLSSFCFACNFLFMAPKLPIDMPYTSTRHYKQPLSFRWWFPLDEFSICLTPWNPMRVTVHWETSEFSLIFYWAYYCWYWSLFQLILVHGLT